jgi:hypothetical protein
MRISLSRAIIGAVILTGTWVPGVMAAKLQIFNAAGCERTKTGKLWTCMQVPNVAFSEEQINALMKAPAPAAADIEELEKATQ